MKLNTLLAKTDHAASSFKAMVKDYLHFFKNNQKDFKGVKKTYTPREGTADEASMRGNERVVTTVTEKLAWFKENSKDYINNLFSVEATNASGVAKARLKIGTLELELSSLELLRLKSMLESGELEQMYANIPTRSDAENWAASDNDQYQNRAVFQSPESGGIKRTLFKENYILTDPNIAQLKDTSKYTPVVATKDTVIELGDYTVQYFSGEYSHRQRAEILQRRSKLLTAVVEALKEANDKDATTSQLTSDLIFGYLHG